LDGKSIKPVIHGKSNQVRDTLFTSYRSVQRSIRDERWKLIRYPQINKTQLFDLKTDPDEMHNLADNPAQTKRVSRMLALIAARQKQLGDDLPLTSAQPGDPTFTPPKQKKNR
jgi:arylsulfatase A-like enzyme